MQYLYIRPIATIITPFQEEKIVYHNNRKIINNQLIHKIIIQYYRRIPRIPISNYE